MLDELRMYCIDTGAIAFMFNGGSFCGLTIHPIDTKICMVYLYVVFSLVYWGGVGGHLGSKRDPLLEIRDPGRRKPPHYIKNQEGCVTGPYNKDVPCKFSHE